MVPARLEATGRTCVYELTPDPAAVVVGGDPGARALRHLQTLHVSSYARRPGEEKSQVLRSGPFKRSGRIGEGRWTFPHTPPHTDNQQLTGTAGWRYPSSAHGEARCRGACARWGRQQLAVASLNTGPDHGALSRGGRPYAHGWRRRCQHSWLTVGAPRRLAAQPGWHDWFEDGGEGTHYAPSRALGELADAAEVDAVQPGAPVVGAQLGETAGWLRWRAETVRASGKLKPGGRCGARHSCNASLPETGREYAASGVCARSMSPLNVLLDVLAARHCSPLLDPSIIAHASHHTFSLVPAGYHVRRGNFGPRLPAINDRAGWWR